MNEPKLTFRQWLWREFMATFDRRHTIFVLILLAIGLVIRLIKFFS